jgi:hypothetical protein
VQLGSSPWTARATGGGNMIHDPAAIRWAVELFADPAGGFELMALTAGKHRTLAGGDVDGICKAATELPGGIGIYFRINPVPPTLDRPAKNGDVLSRRWLYIDVDPVKASERADDPATEEEKARTGPICDAIVEYLSGFEWPAPIVVDSGNGHGLFYRCDTANDQTAAVVFRSLLNDLANKFSGEQAVIDKAVHNANRLAKLPGTWARKGVSSEDRPHRPCQLIHVPKVIESLTLDQITAVVRPAADEPRKPLATVPAPASQTRTEAYGRKALELECARVALARPPAQGGDGRNNALNRAAFSLGQLVAGGVLAEGDVVTRLTEAACHTGLDSDTGGLAAVESTIRRGLVAGQQQSRGVPESNDPKAVLKSKIESDEIPLVVMADTVKFASVEWLVKNRIPKGFITVVAGRTGIGKSFVLLDIIARLSRGDEIPFSNSERFVPGGALILSEDSHEHVLGPRLFTMNANLGRIGFMTWEAMAAFHLSDTEMLSKAVDQVRGGASVVLIDPPTNFLGDSDSHKDSEIRQLVMKVVQWAIDRKLAVVFILHVNKQAAKGVEALNRVMGSVAWVTTSRVAHTCCPDPDDSSRNLWVPMKSNIGPLAKAWAYRIEQPDGTEHAKLAWLEEVDINADDAMSGGTPEKKNRGEAAAAWLIERFSEKLEWPSDDLIKEAKANGISRNAVWEAKDLLSLPKPRRVVSETGNISWVWWVPADWVEFEKPVAA